MEVPLSRMGSMMKLTTQNPLSLLVKFGIMAWNGTCADNCSGHGECHNGTCLCEVGLTDLQWKHTLKLVQYYFVYLLFVFSLKQGLLILLLVLENYKFCFVNVNIG
jgi:hypothetical protein